MRVAVYDLYWETYGGGEQVDGSIAQVLAENHEVTLLGPKPVDIELFKSRLGIDLSACDYRRVTDDVEAGEASADYDLFVNGTYLSKALNQAARGWYYVHFPGLAISKMEQRRNRMYMGAVKALAAPARYVQGAREWQAAFDRRVQRFHFLAGYQHFLANSQFTASWVEQLWNVPTFVLYPPVRPTIKPGAKSPIILSLGRFFDPSHGHCKKQLDLVEAFRRLHLSGAAPGWEFVVVGGANASDREYVLSVRRAAQGLPIRVIPNAPGSLVESLLAEASIFWHAGGYGEDPMVHPERFEHFGIALVEAMSAGAVPVVYGAAGPAEIVRSGVDGWHWSELDEVVQQTSALIAAPTTISAMAHSSVERAADFSAAVFAGRLRELASVIR